MLYKIDMHLLSILIAKGNKPAQKIACVYMRTEELLTTEKLNSDLTAVGLLVMCTQEERGRLQRTSGKWGGGAGFEISDISGRGVVCESSDVRKFLKKSKFLNFSELFIKLKLEIIIDRDSNMKAIKHSHMTSAAT